MAAYGSALCRLFPLRGLVIGGRPSPIVSAALGDFYAKSPLSSIRFQTTPQPASKLRKLKVIIWLCNGPQAEKEPRLARKPLIVKELTARSGIATLRIGGQKGRLMRGLSACKVCARETQ